MSRPIQAGDLALVVNATNSITRRNLGKLVLVLGPAQAGRHHGYTFDAACQSPGKWFIQSLGQGLWADSSHGAMQIGVVTTHARNLRPIDQPGDHAVDESKAWLPPVPARKRVQP